MPAPVKKYKVGNFECSIWNNERKFEGSTVEYQTLTLAKRWKDNKNITREQKLNIRKNDIEKVLVLLRKIQEELLLEEK
tara:strand:- start:392 stop:628 length:237 start_codon:yes stop_codon:yes gene_type:complete